MAEKSSVKSKPKESFHDLDMVTVGYVTLDACSLPMCFGVKEVD